MKHFGLAFALVCVILCAACGGVPPEPTGPTPTPSPTSTATPKTTPTPTPMPTPTPWPTPYPKKAGAPTIGVLVHYWYGASPDSCPTVGNPFYKWPFWIWGWRLDDPCNTYWSVGAPWLREISSPVYPTIGPYDGRNEEVRRQQMREAKAGGIDEFWATTNSWVPANAYLHDLFFGNDEQHIKGSLEIATEEGFHMGLEKWGLGEGDNIAYWAPLWKEDFLGDYDSVMKSKFKNAYGYTNGLPTFWSFYPRWMLKKDTQGNINYSELIEFLDGTDTNPRAMNVIFRACSLQEVIDLNETARMGFVVIKRAGNIGDAFALHESAKKEIATLNSKLRRSRVQYQSMNNFPTETGWSTDPNGPTTQNLIRDLDASKQAGLIPIAHTYAGFDERAGVPNPAEPYSMRYGLRNGTRLLSEFMTNAIAHGATRIMIESWDEWGEGSTIAPAYPVVQWRDFGQEKDLYRSPTQYLEVLWSFVGGGPWTAPPPPPCSAVDPLMRQYYPSYQCRP